LAIDVPRDVSVNLTYSPFGFGTMEGLGVDMPICSNENEMVLGVNSSARKWTIQDIWWPPTLTDCKGSLISFNLDPKQFDPPEPLENWKRWVNEYSGSEFVAIEMTWNLSSWESPWGKNGVVPDMLVCEFRFENQDWGSCEVLSSNMIIVPKNTGRFDLKWSWTELSGLDRSLVVEYSIPQFQIKEFSELNFEYSNLNENVLIVKGGSSEGDIIVLFGETGEHAFVNMVDERWDLNETSMSCDEEKYWIMGVNSDESLEFNIGNNTVVYEEGNLSISALIINLTWEEKIQNGEIIYLILENKDEGHHLSLPLKSFDLLELHGHCEEVSLKTSNLVLKGVFYIWILLTTIMLVSGFLFWKKQQELGKNGLDEES